MNIEAQESAINGELIRLTRESRGWALGDLATRSCMSIRQIRQLEEGGTSSFYSLGVKVTAVKRVAVLLGLTPDQVFASPAIEVQAAFETAAVPSVPVPSISVTASPDAPLVLVSQSVMVSQAESDALTGVSSHADGASDDAAALAHDFESAPSVQTVPANEPFAEVGAQIAPASAPEIQAEEPADKPKVSFVTILILFAAALGVAAVMRPEAEPLVLESSPPVLAVPDVSPSVSTMAPASAALVPTEPASASASSTLTKPAQVSASASAVVAASAPGSVQAQPRVASPSALGASLALPAPVASTPRSAAIASAAASAASSPASKAP